MTKVTKSIGPETRDLTGSHARVDDLGANSLFLLFEKHLKDDPVANQLAQDAKLNTDLTFINLS